MNTNGVRKEEIERRLGRKITDSRFETALEYARKKQLRIYECENRPLVLQRWYLVELVEEQVRNSILSELMMGLCRIVYDMENECQARSHSTHAHTHIVTCPALKSN